MDTTDGLHAPEGLDEREAMALMKRSYQQILRVAEAHEVVVNIEPHGYFTTNPEMMARMQAFSDSPYLRLTMDTGNTYIAAHPEPVSTPGLVGALRGLDHEARVEPEGEGLLLLHEEVGLQGVADEGQRAAEDAAADVVQWLDDGPPKTVTAPPSSAR